MVRTNSILGALLVLGLLILPPASADHGYDECAGGVDAGDWVNEATSLAITGGCAGALYHGNGNENDSHEDDHYDAYSIRVEQNKVLKSQLDLQICNDGKVVHLIYQALWKTDGVAYERHAVGSIAPGECTEAERIEGGYKPGIWAITVSAPEEAFDKNMRVPYTLDAVAR